jgi:hypothetical protein
MAAICGRVYRGIISILSVNGGERRKLAKDHPGGKGKTGICHDYFARLRMARVAMANVVSRTRAAYPITGSFYWPIIDVKAWRVVVSTTIYTGDFQVPLWTSTSHRGT